MSFTVFKIKKPGEAWYELPTPITIQPAVNALDNSKSGRDNNTGMMFRDKIAEKRKYTVEVPAGMTNTQMAALYEILLGNYFVAWGPDPTTGTFTEHNYYCAAIEPKINQIYSLTSWDYESWSFNATEM